MDWVKFSSSKFYESHSALTSFSVVFTLFAASTVFLLLAGQTVETLANSINSTHTSNDYCYIVVILAVAIFPVLLLESPKDFWCEVRLLTHSQVDHSRRSRLLHRSAGDRADRLHSIFGRCAHDKFTE